MKGGALWGPPHPALQIVCMVARIVNVSRWPVSVEENPSEATRGVPSIFLICATRGRLGANAPANSYVAATLEAIGKEPKLSARERIRGLRRNIFGNLEFAGDQMARPSPAFAARLRIDD